VTGSGGLIGSQAARHFAALGLDVVGVDNDMRAVFFGAEASTGAVSRGLQLGVPGYQHHDLDVRDRGGIESLWRKYGHDIALVVHTAAQPSHDWAAREPLTDFDVNAVGTLNVLEMTRLYAPDAVLIHCSTNKVYGDRPNDLPLEELDTRYEYALTQPALGWNGIDEDMSIDSCLHSVFGASKVAADVMAQEYGRYFGLRTGVFRGGCLTGPGHQGAELHGFLAYLVRCVCAGETYRVIGYGGKQVRDVIHARDVVTAFEHFWRDPHPGEVYNLGGGRHANVSVFEALTLAEEITGRAAKTETLDQPRRGDHIWYISDMAKFRGHYPQWVQTCDIPTIMRELAERWAA
jgi:CDP-paratose 2-epimerase